MAPHDSRHNPRSGAGSHRHGNEFSQLALWMAANLAGLMTTVLLMRAPFFKALAGRSGRGRPAGQRPSPRQSLPLLAGTIIGSSKFTIESVFGPPRSASVREVGVIVHPKMVFWNADTWYYPLPREGPMAMAINFTGDLAEQVEFFTAPKPPAA